MRSKRPRPAHPADYYGVDDVVATVNEVFHLEGTHRGREYDIPCPNPGHDDRSPSCGVNKESGYWHCFSCGVGGDIVELGSLVLGTPPEDIERLLSPHTAEALLTRVQGRLRRLSAPIVRAKPIVIPEHDIRFKGQVSDLHDRLFTQKTLDKWGVKWIDEYTMTGQKGEYTITNSIAIPIRDARGTVLAWCYRATGLSGSWQPRYLYTPTVEISDLWWGDEHHSKTPHVTVVEGALDGMWCDQNHFPAKALLGSKMGTRKILRLQDHEAITLLGDLDSAGMVWVARVGDMLGTQMPVSVAQYSPWMMKKTPEPDGSVRRAKDPEELTPVDLELVHGRSLPYVSWRLKYPPQRG